MIGKGNHHAHGVKLAAYLVTGHPGERAELIDMRGFGMCDLRDGFRIEQMRAEDGTKAEKPFFHVHFRGAEGERAKLGNAQWAEIADRCDKALGLADQPRAASLHIDRQTGDKHLHLGYSLVAVSENGRGYVKKLGLYKNKLKKLSREIERDYGLKVVSNERQPGNIAKGADRREFEESRRLGTSINDIRTAILGGFEKSDSGKSFAAAMQAQGFEIAAGDRRDCFVVVDRAGGQHALNKKLTGKTLAEIRQRLLDLDRSQLPTVEKAQALQLDRKAEREALQTREAIRGADAPGKTNTPPQGPENRPSVEKNPLPELGATAGEIRLAWSLTRTADQFAQSIEDRGLILVYVSREEADASHRAHAFAKVIDRQRRELKEGFGVVDRRGNVTRIEQRTTGDQWEEIQKRLGGIDRRELLTVAQAREVMADANKIEFAEKKQAERNAARAATPAEQKILDAAAAAAGDRQKFSAELDKAGIALARVTAVDVAALDALRKDEAITAAADPAHKVQQFANVEAGELVAVDKRGDIHRLNPHHMAGLEILAGGDDPPSVVAVRAGFEIDRQEATSFQQTMIDNQLARRDEQTHGRMLAFENRQAEAADRATDRELNNAADHAERGVRKILGGLETAVSRAVEAVAAPLEGLASFLGDLLSAPAALTKDQAERKIAANAERQVEAADRQQAAAKEQAQDDLISEQNRTESIDNTLLYSRYGVIRPVDQPRERDVDRGQELEQER